MTSPVRHLFYGIAFLLIVCLVAIIGYMMAGWTLVEAAYMAVVTVFTVGYGEVRELTTPGMQIFTMGFIICGCTGYLYIGGALVQFLVEGQIENTLGKRRMSKSIENLTNHTIICGFGRVGRMLATELEAAKHPFVIIERSETAEEEIQEKGYNYLRADATSEKALIRAGVEKASEIAVVLPDDSANVFVTLSARNLNPELSIVARGMTPSTEGKLMQAGADRVVLPEHIGAERIASLILRPTASSLLTDELVISHLANDLADLGLNVEEFSIPPGSNLAGRTPADLETAGSSAFLIVAIVRANGEAVHSPPMDTFFNEGDILIVVCHSGTPPDFTEVFALKRESVKE
ncbi:MAG: potassium channel protein [Verrucomicrobiales bacterium]|nr:potassium channel protein [Verrucomicrobiales bacterium]